MFGMCMLQASSNVSMTIYHNELPIEVIVPFGFTANLLSRKVKLIVNGIATVISQGKMFNSITCN